MHNSKNVGSSSQPPIDIAQLLQRILKQSNAIHSLTTSINRQSNAIVDFVTIVKQSVA